MLKIVTAINWIAIALLAILVLILILEPNKGGDAASKGMGQAFILLGLAALGVLLLLNLLPYAWSRYTGFLLLLLPFALYALNAGWEKIRARRSYQPIGQYADGNPWFNNQEKQNLALAIFHGDTDKVQAMLKQQGRTLLDKNDEALSMLEFAVSEATYTTYKPEEKTACVKALFDAGAKIGLDADSSEVITSPAFTGNAALVQLLLEHGANPNAKNTLGSPVLFEAIISYKKPNETVSALLNAGADPNTIHAESDTDSTSALLRAARVGRWNICCQLIAKGADPRYVGSDGQKLEDLIREGSAYFQGDGYSTVEDLKQLKAAIAKQ